MNTKLHAVTDTLGRPIRFFMTAGQVSDYTGARALVSNLPAAEWLLGDRGYDADWFREALVNMGIKPAFQGESHEAKPSSTTSGDTKNVTGLRSCLAA